MSNALQQGPCIGIVGLGRMGRALAERLAGQGLDVHGWTRSGLAGEDAQSLGITAEPSLEGLAGVSDVLVLSLFDDQAVREVLHRLLAQDVQGKVLIDTSTVSPDLLRHHLDQTDAAGLRVLDAPISGGPELVRAGTCGIFVGGDPADFARQETLFSVLSDRVRYVGPLGAGLAMKIVNNALLQGVWAALIDVMGLAKTLDLPMETGLRLLAEGPAANPMMVARLPRILGEDPSVGFAIDGALKDCELFLEVARKADLDVPVLQTILQAWREAQAAGLGSQDVAALIPQTYAKA